MKLPTYLSLIATASLVAVVPLDTAFGFSARNLPSKRSATTTTAVGVSKADSTSTSPTTSTSASASSSSDAFIFRDFHVDATSCDDNNRPPTLQAILKNIRQLTTQGSDIRGTFVDHPRLGRLGQCAKVIGDQANHSGVPALTPFVAFCLGHAFAQMVLQQQQQQQTQQQQQGDEPVTIALGRDPRPHGAILCDAFGRGASSANPNIRVVYTGIATTPSMFHFCRAGLCDGAVMVTASHLPSDRNGFKLFTPQGGFTKGDVFRMNQLASNFAQQWHDEEGGVLPPTSGGDGVFCSEWVDYMPNYASTLKDAICSEVQKDDKPLQGLKIVLNSGNGSGGFFNQVLKDLGADVSASIHVEPNPNFPAGIPNPEKKDMIEETIQSCQQISADLGILLDTDADRSGFVVPMPNGEFEPLNRNRLIALLSVIFSRSSPGCSVVTDSVTSEGLAKFLEDDLGLKHVRYLKGYANVIGRAQELNANKGINAEMAIETSGHCAMKENGFLDDGTYTAVKVIGLLAREKLEGSPDLLGLISGMKEMPEESELRMEVTDGSLETMAALFDLAAIQIHEKCNDPSSSWMFDVQNLEGIRVRTGDGGFFMLRKSLHDPVICMQVESASKQSATETVVGPLLKIFQSINQFNKDVDLSALKGYGSSSRSE